MDDKTVPTLQANPMMRGSRLYGIHDMRVEAVPRPAPGPGEVLLKVACVGVCGSDVHYYLEGRIGSQIIDAPLVLGHEFSARVAQVGPGVEGLTPGQLVAVEPAVSCGECEFCEHGHPNLCPYVKFCGCPPYNGAFAEYVVMPAANCFPLPQGFSSQEGAMLEPLGVAIHAVDLAHLKPGQTVAVLGAGSIGLLTAAVARAAGASEIFMTEPLAYRRTFARDYVANAVLDPAAVDVGVEIQKLTAGRGVDVVFETAGASTTPQEAADAVRIGGKVIVAGIPADNTMTMTASVIRRKGLTIKLVRRMKHTYPRAIKMLESGMLDVKPLVTHVLPLEEIGQAFAMVADYQDDVIRAMIQVAEE